MASLAFLCVATAATLAGPGEAPALSRFSYSQTQMGVPFTLLLYAPNEASANLAADKAFERIEDLNGILSDYDPQSELSRLSVTAGSGRSVQVSDDLWYVLEASQELNASSNGAFDITVGPLVDLWRRARRSKRMPAPEKLRAALKLVGSQHLRLDKAKQTAELLTPGMRLDLGGIAMGYAVDEAIKTLKAEGVNQALIDASGDVGVADAPPGEKGWRVGIATLEPEGPPTRYLLLANAAVTTSGDAFQHVVIDGVRYSHIVHPKTGLGLTDHSTVTVVASNCMAADGLATAVSVLGQEAGMKLIDKLDGAAAHIVRLVDGKTKVYESPGIKLLELPSSNDREDKSTAEAN
jgi:thiamine biosynthesis lipoprotein